METAMVTVAVTVMTDSLAFWVLLEIERRIEELGRARRV
jgi:hypothetical protein